MNHFKIEHIDHVAIRANNPEASIKWYADILGLKELRAEAWGEFPVFMVSGETSVAIFPGQANNSDSTESDKMVRIDHFAFRLSKDNFLRAKDFFTQSNIPFQFKDHTYFHSVYLKDPDNHTVELTTLVADAQLFYKW